MTYGHVYSETDALLDDLRASIETTIDEDLVGLYIFGSLIHGGFTPGVSDVDLLAVSRRFITEHDIDQLRTMHSEVVTRHPGWDDRIEVAYQSLHGLKSFHTERSPMGIISPGEPIHLIEAGAEWLLNWYFVLDHGVTLTGPPPETIIAPIPFESFAQSCQDNARRLAKGIDHVADQRGESYAILTACRALYTHHTGQHASKQQAARWTQERFPAWSGLIEMALDRRVLPDENGMVDTHADTARFLDLLVACMGDEASAASP